MPGTGLGSQHMPSAHQPLFGCWYLTVGGKKMQELAGQNHQGGDVLLLLSPSSGTIHIQASVKANRWSFPVPSRMVGAISAGAVLTPGVVSA